MLATAALLCLLVASACGSDGTQSPEGAPEQPSAHEDAADRDLQLDHEPQREVEQAEEPPRVAVEREEWSSVQPYSADSPWNTPIPEDPPVHPRSDEFTERVGGTLTSDVTQYTLPVYQVDDETALVPVVVKGLYSEVSDHGGTLYSDWEQTVQVPIPHGAVPAEGSDGQLVVVNVDTGEEWGFWQIEPEDEGDGWVATNGYRYHLSWNAVPPESFGSRGAGVPYLAGLIRPAEIEAGLIEHAIAFAYPTPSPEHVFPATKSDGPGSRTEDLPEGARLQLDPSLTDADFVEMGLDKPGRVIARALQEYGMILIDLAGRTKIYAEYEGTAGWRGTITEETVDSLPLSAFRVIDWREALGGPIAEPDTATSAVHGSILRLDASPSYDPDGNVVAWEWAAMDGTVLNGEADPLATWDTAHGDPGLQGFLLRVRNDAGAWSEPREVVVEVHEPDGPFVSDVVEAAAADADEAQSPPLLTSDDDVLIVAVTLRRINPQDDVAVDEIAGAGRTWTRVHREAGEGGALALEVWAAEPGHTTDDPITVSLTEATNIATQALSVSGASAVADVAVAQSGDDITKEATVGASADGEGTMLGFHAGRTEDFVPVDGVEPLLLNTTVEDVGGSVRLSSMFSRGGPLAGSTRSPMDWIMAAVDVSDG